MVLKHAFPKNFLPLLYDMQWAHSGFFIVEVPDMTSEDPLRMSDLRGQNFWFMERTI